MKKISLLRLDLGDECGVIGLSFLNVEFNKTFSYTPFSTSAFLGITWNNFFLWIDILFIRITIKL